MGVWCSCVECIGYESEQGIEKEPQAMDHQIKPVNPRDILRSKVDGTWSYRGFPNDNSPMGLLEAYEAIPFNSPEWHRLRLEDLKPLQILVGDES